MSRKINILNLGIVIASKKPSINLYLTLSSIKKSSMVPSQVIIVIPKNKNFELIKKKFSKFIFMESKFSNQVYQRTLGIKNFNKNILICLQLDDRVLLKKNTIKELISMWNSVSFDTAGIGLNPIGQIRPKPNLFHKITHTNENKDAYVLKNGFCTGWNELKKRNLKAYWLNGGMTSWNLKLVKNLKNRKFPMISWCVAEDLIFSYEISKKYNLLISSKAKAKFLKKNEKNTLISSFSKGYYHSKIINSFVCFEKNLSYILFLYSSISSSLIGMILCFFKLDMINFFRFLGRLSGIVSFYNKKNFK